MIKLFDLNGDILISESVVSSIRCYTEYNRVSCCDEFFIIVTYTNDKSSRYCIPDNGRNCKIIEQNKRELSKFKFGTPQSKVKIKTTDGYAIIDTGNVQSAEFYKECDDDEYYTVLIMFKDMKDMTVYIDDSELDTSMDSLLNN